LKNWINFVIYWKKLLSHSRPWSWVCGLGLLALALTPLAWLTSLFVCQHDSSRGSRCFVQKSWPSSNLGVIARLLGAHPPGKMWRWATTLGKSAQAV